MANDIVTVNCPNEDCEHPFEFELDCEPADPDVGFMSDSWNVMTEPPVSCPSCKTVYTAAEREKMGNEADAAADDYSPGDDEDPDFFRDESDHEYNDYFPS